LRRLTAAAAIVVAVAACGSGSRQEGLTVRVDDDPFRIALLRDGKTVVQQDRDARLRYQLATTAEQHKLTKVTARHGTVYTVATDEPGRTATVTVRRTAHGARISLRLHPETNVAQVYDAFGARRDEHFLGGGEHGDRVDLRGAIVPIKVSVPCSYAPIPFFASSAGWGLRLDTENVAALAFAGSPGGSGCKFGDELQCGFPALPTRTEVCVRGARLDEDLYAGTAPDVLAAYERDAGRPAVPPPSQLELVKWRDAVAGPQDVLEDVTRLQAARIPLGWVLLDNPWEPCVGKLTFDPARIPDPAGLIRQVHARGVRFMLWISPLVTCDAGYPPSALLGQALDLRQPPVVAEFRRRLGALLALGVDGVKGDRGDEVDLEPRGESLQNEYPLLYAKAVAGVLPRGASTIFRAATMGSQHVLPGFWGGDQPGDFTGLQRAIRLGQTAAMSGFPTWGSDVGGYSSGALTAEVFARWAQFGAVSPVMEVGGNGPNATPWTLGAEAMDALRDAAVLHYELFPYLYGLVRAGLPVLRPLGYAYPDDERAWRSDLEFLVGPDLLAAPVTGAGATPSVYLPAGSWVDLFTGRAVGGGRTLTRPTPLAQFPLYARAGAVVPFNLRTATGSWWGVSETAHAGRAGFLVTNGARLDLRGQPHAVQLFVPAARRPARVTIGGRPVAAAWNAGPLPGAVIRLHGPRIEGEIRLR
jgi:alpha-D-xyloside xylohydrolase